MTYLTEQRIIAQTKIRIKRFSWVIRVANGATGARLARAQEDNFPRG
jgi:hypothetical protein